MSCCAVHRAVGECHGNLFAVEATTYRELLESIRKKERAMSVEITVPLFQDVKETYNSSIGLCMDNSDLEKLEFFFYTPMNTIFTKEYNTQPTEELLRLNEELAGPVIKLNSFQTHSNTKTNIGKTAHKAIRRH
mmetsp:Transcript_13874/g.17452  ORF Transcript_13874/g.17452 Transcript_13874/m.17452 type:complete len:134 (+) Transcript_13874:18-419(+)